MSCGLVCQLHLNSKSTAVHGPAHDAALSTGSCHCSPCELGACFAVLAFCRHVGQRPSTNGLSLLYMKYSEPSGTGISVYLVPMVHDDNNSNVDDAVTCSLEAS